MDHATKPNASVSETPEPQAARAVDLTGKNLGDYRILRRLGQGGMGQIYLAEQVSLKRHVALKFLKPELAANAVALKRFKAEAEAVARATHANIVQVYAIHEIEGHHLIALEYVEGRNLREYLEKKGPPEILMGLSIIRQVAAALQRASELGIIHRDIKPENILLTRKGEVKVADFGLSRVLSDASTPAPHLTQSHVTMGTPLYMSPEQVEGKKTIDHRTDIYSFGVTCYHMFAGHPPFKGTAPFEVAVQHVQNEPVPLTQIRPDLPPELCAIVHKMMVKSPADRYQMGREVVRDIAKLRDVLVGASQAVVVTVPVTNAAPAPAQATDLMATLALPSMRASPWPRRLLLAALPVALAGGLALSGLRSQVSPAAVTVLLPAPENHVALAKPVDPLKEKDEALFKVIQDLNIQDIPAKVTAAWNSAIELGLLYLKDRDRIEDADDYFKRLTKQKRPVFKVLGRLGTAMVVAFKDQPEESNRLFLSVLGKDKAEAAFRRSEPSLREMIARALNFNRLNNPAGFPERLRPFLQPPAPTLTSARTP